MAAETEESRVAATTVFAYWYRPVPWVTLTFAVLMFATLLAQVVVLRGPSPEVYPRIFVRSLDWWAQPWTLVTANFAHKGWPHLKENLVSFLLLGAVLERWLGHRRFLAFYLVAGVISGVLGLYAEALTSPPGSPPTSLGASGAVWGMIGLTAVCVPMLWHQEFRRLRTSAGRPWVKVLEAAATTPRAHELLAVAVVLVQLQGLLQWAPMMEGIGRVGNYAHAAGLVIGLVAASPRLVGRTWLARVPGQGAPAPDEDETPA